MGAPRVSIGIDLGTTNSAMAFAPLAQDAATEVVSIPQLHSYSAVVRRSTLPSFLYLPEYAIAAQLPGKSLGGSEWVAGVLAEKKARDVPGRVVRSAKSWLCHHAVDREAPFLPWGSQELPPHRKISPVRAAALILGHLRDAWNERFAASGTDFAFDAQDITITVPASFDAVAQRLTLAAAHEAGFPDTARLLEEPQAAFYRWLEEHDQGSDLWSRLPGDGAGNRYVLVMDVGGGTSDFSLFKIQPATGTTPAIERVAVSDHILLGGDNIDLAMAHLAEPRLVQGDSKLTGSPWDHLVARCREVKEQALSSEGPADEQFSVSIPGRGSSLMADARSTRITRSEIEHLLLEGFFPECGADARVRRTQLGLRELGLPYASDSAMTRHLAAFLRDRPNVDAVLFNGGSLHPAPLRQRICREIAKWQGGPEPSALITGEPDLAVARGAAHFGRLLQHKSGRIKAGAAHAVFLEAHSQSTANDGNKPAALVCILPHGAVVEETFEITDLPLELRINRPVRFQTYVSTRHDASKAGDVISGNTDDLRPLPPLQTIARIDKAANRESERAIPVILTTRLNELGLLQVACRSTHPRIRQSLPLDFDLRRHGQEGPEDPATEVLGGKPAQVELDVAPEALAASRERITTLFAQPLGQRDKLTAARLIQSLEKILGTSKGDWNGALVRALWPAVEACAAQRRQSIEHEETWLILAGFLLRPGFGAAADEARIDGLWKVSSGGPCFPNKRVKLQEYILWRRVSGGLSRERQEFVLARELDSIRRQKSPAPELIRLAGSLERIGLETKAELIERFIEAAAALARGAGHCAPYLAALGSLLNRAPLYAGQEGVVSPKLVERAYEAFSGLDWSAAELMELQMLFLRAARVVGDRTLDVAPQLRSKIADRLEKVGVAPVRTARLRGFVPVPASERLGLFGESLPAGLILSNGPAAP